MLRQTGTGGAAACTLVGAANASAASAVVPPAIGDSAGKAAIIGVLQGGYEGDGGSRSGRSHSDPAIGMYLAMRVRKIPRKFFSRTCRNPARPVRRRGEGPPETNRRGSTTMRFMMLVKASKESEAGQMPSQAELEEMGRYNEELVKAGVMLAGEGLHPSSQGARVDFNGDEPHGHRRPVRGVQGADRRLLDHPGVVEGGGASSGRSGSRSARACSSSGRSSSRRTSRTSPPTSSPRRTRCGTGSPAPVARHRLTFGTAVRA